MKRRRNSVNSTTPVVCKKAKINDSTSEDVTPVNKEQSVSPSTRKPLEKTPTTKVNAELIHVYTVTHSFDSWQGDRDENQDQYYVTENYSPDYLLSLLTQNIDYSKDDSDEKQTIGIFGVYDGHGPAGLEGAKITREKMPKFITKNLSFLPSFAFSNNFFFYDFFKIKFQLNPKDPQRRKKSKRLCVELSRKSRKGSSKLPRTRNQVFKNSEPPPSSLFYGAATN